MSSVCILGSGLMACDIGVFFLKRGHAVTWLAGTEARRQACEQDIVKQIRRMVRAEYEIPTTRIGVRGCQVIDKSDILIECTGEEIAKKIAAIHSVLPLLDAHDAPLLLSTSSSILPSEIHPACIGCHFFYPAELTGVVELIQNSLDATDCYTNALDWIRHAGLEVIEQKESNAFAVNRLLLTVQAEAMQLVALGYDTQFVDEASGNDLFPAGILTMMDTVGIDTIYCAALNYVRRMAIREQPVFQPLLDGLRQALDSGKLGRKNGRGLLNGKNATAVVREGSPELNVIELKKLFTLLFCASCSKSLQRGELSETDLKVAMKSVFNSERSFRDCLAGYSAENLSGMAGRPGYLVRAVMQSIYNVGLLGHEAALKEENRLFDSVVREVACKGFE